MNYTRRLLVCTLYSTISNTVAGGELGGIVEGLAAIFTESQSY